MTLTCITPLFLSLSTDGRDAPDRVNPADPLERIEASHGVPDMIARR